MEREEIEKICKEFGIEKYTINKDLSINVEHSVYLDNKNLDKLPLRFNRVGNSFNCSDNQLTTLEGCPKSVGRHFGCFGNQLTTLVGSPQIVNGYFLCNDNPLKTLKEFPQKVNDVVRIDGKWFVDSNISEYQDGVIDKIYKFFGDSKLFHKSLFYNWFEDGKIIDFKLNRAIKETLKIKIIIG